MRISGLETEAEWDEQVSRVNKFNKVRPKTRTRTQHGNPIGLKIYRKNALIDLMGGECMVCHGKFNQVAMDFHHKNPEEREGRGKVTIGTRISNEPEGTFWDKTVPYIRDKCMLVCSNCHRIIHWGSGR